MQQNYSDTQLPTAASQIASGDGATWTNPSNITADDGNDSTLQYFNGGDFGATLIGSDFDFRQLPDSAVIDGVELFVDGSQLGCHGDISLNLTGTSSKDLGTLSGSYGSATDLWGADQIDKSELAGLEVSIFTGDVSGGDGVADVNYISVTIYWHLELPNNEAEIPTRIDYKVFARDGSFLGLLPNVTSKLAFPEDINSAGTSIVITCGSYINNEVSVEPLLTEGGDPITTEDDLPILATSVDFKIAQGNDEKNALFKNSNRVVAVLYNNYYPNGKPMFSGQINRVSFKYGGGDASVKLTVYSDGMDLNNFVARGYPFSYTNDVSQTTSSTYNTVYRNSAGKGDGWDFFGQTWTVGGGVTNLGALVLRLQGTASVTVYVYDRPNGNLLGSVTKSVNKASAGTVQFEFANLIGTTPGATYFWACTVAPGQSIRIYRSTTNVYAGGTRYRSQYSGGSGGGAWQTLTTQADYYFVTKSGTPTTTATYSSDDPVTEMASNILIDYNNRGGLVKERDFEATGLSLTYTFVVAFIYDVIQKILELCPTGYYAYVDVGTAEIDIKQTSETADFTIVKGRHINELNIDLTIEQVKNYLLFTGGDTGGGSNLYREYSDTQSSSLYGLRTDTKTDNRVTVTGSADAIGDTFVEENADEQQETTLTVLNELIDITLLTPGKTIGFKNFDNFIDDLVLQIVRREGNYDDGVAVLTLGRLPVRMNDQIQSINRALLNEQTIDNPSAPS